LDMDGNDWGSSNEVIPSWYYTNIF
jgi:hypothetical protein